MGSPEPVFPTLPRVHRGPFTEEGAEAGLPPTLRMPSAEGPHTGPPQFWGHRLRPWLVSCPLLRGPQGCPCLCPCPNPLWARTHPSDFLWP